jgi:tetratricopeptide (TPR) repeat protein
LATRHKISRKELKQPDEFQSIFETAALFFELHQTEMLIGLAALLAVAAIVCGVYFYQAGKTRAAAARFEQAMSELEGGKYDAAEKSLASLAADEPRRAVGRLSNLYLGIAYLAQKQPAKARDAFQRYLAADDTSIFRGAALDDLAVTYEDLGDFKQAEDLYRQAAKIDGPEQARAELGVARMLQRQGQRADAVAAYNDFLSQHPYAPERTTVMETLAEMGASSPAAAPPAPPAVSLKPLKPAAAP